MKFYSTAAALAAAQLCVTNGAAAQDLPPRDDSRYLYTMDLNAAIDCTLIQDRLQKELAETDPAAMRFHEGMTRVWAVLADEINGSEVASEVFNSRWAAVVEKPYPDSDAITALYYLARPCEVMSNIYGDRFRVAENAQAELHPEFFADHETADGKRRNQAGAPYAKIEPKEILFGKWFFFARNNSCLAGYNVADGATLTFAFTNFFDGAISVEWDGLPKLDANSDDYEADFEVHRQGADYDEDYAPRIAEGFTYDTYPGTGIFVDGKLVAGPFGQGRSDGHKYYFGVAIQRPYYNMLPTGETLTIKVLGKETHSLKINDPAFWNEMSNCMAQYPFG